MEISKVKITCVIKGGDWDLRVQFCMKPVSDTPKEKDDIKKVANFILYI